MTIIEAKRLETGDRRRREWHVWDNWMNHAAQLCGRFYGEVETDDPYMFDDPFAYNETASVSLLASAAACAGYLGLAEFTTQKRSRGDRRKISHGRCDLWLCEEASWAFEFKQIRGSSVGAKRIEGAMEDAVRCARQIHSNDADAAVAGLILSLAFWEGEERERIRSRIEDFTLEGACSDRYAWQISGPRTVDENIQKCETFLIFDVVKRF
ncbi:hypothetical protein [Fulvimarina sp. MAC8]|uniref:hypothetical protein n=1 Tax=Fulvimarina sp. MAC8 TaxID=3162874 RepID=UPI0032F03D27